MLSCVEERSSEEEEGSAEVIASEDDDAQWYREEVGEDPDEGTVWVWWGDVGGYKEAIGKTDNCAIAIDSMVVNRNMSDKDRVILGLEGLM